MPGIDAEFFSGEKGAEAGEVDVSNGSTVGTVRMITSRLTQSDEAFQLPSYGEMAEWSKALDSKSSVPPGTQGSNPCLSAIFVYIKGYSISTVTLFIITLRKNTTMVTSW